MEQKNDSLRPAQNEKHEAVLTAIARLQGLSTRLIQAGRLHSLLKEILAASAEILNADKGNIQFVDPQTDSLRIVIHQGLSRRFLEHFSGCGFTWGCEKAKKDKCRIIFEDINTLPAADYPDVQVFLDEGIGAFQSTPLISREGRVLGTLNNHFSAPHRPSEDELCFLDLLARMAADLIERKEVEEQLRISYNELEKRVRQRTAELDTKNAELEDRADQLARLASEITLAEEQERHRLAQVLHDHLQQVLVAAKMELTVLARKVTDSEPQALIEDISNLMEESIRESRSLTTELSPPILHEAGLGAGLEWLVRRMQHKYGMQVTLDVSEQIELQRDDVSILCFQSVRELLFNSVKHSGVKTAAVCLRHNDLDLEIRVSDEGRGLDPEQIWKKSAGGSGGFGLFSIRERLTLLGGTFKIDSTPGGGATFRLIIPHSALQAAPAAATEPFSSGGALVSPAHRKIRVLLVDDHTVMRRGLASMLRQEPDIEIIGEAQDGHEAIERSRRFRPDIILMDFSMPRMNGLDATRHIHHELPHIRIIGLSMFDEAERAAAMINAGACAYACKSEPPEVILKAIRSAFAGVHRHSKNMAVHSDSAPIRIVPAELIKQPAEDQQPAQKRKADRFQFQPSLFD